MHRLQLVRTFAVIVLAILFTSCSQQMTKTEVPTSTAVQVELKSGEIFNGFVTNSDARELEIVLAENNKSYRVGTDKIAAVKPLSVVYDTYAREISETEIAAEQSYWRTITFATLGGIFGGTLGYFLGAQADSDKDAEINSAGTYVGAGVGIASGILLGLPSDRAKAISTIRKERAQNPPAELLQERETEAEKLKKLEAEKQRLQRELEKK
jgi:hypothetical protein